MEFDFVWLLWALPGVFGLGWLMARYDLRQGRLESRTNPKAYFRGLNHLLNEQQDQAIDAFIEAVQKDPDTSELHFALGNLFRRRGDYDRAVRVHEHLLGRADLNQKDRDRAQQALSQDFLKAGLLDRAEQALLKLEGTAFEAQAHLSLLQIYERTRDWVQAAEVAENLEHAEHGTFRLRLAHYRCEQAAALRATGRVTEALTLLETLVQQVPQSARAWVSLADLRHSLNNNEGAWIALKQLCVEAPSHLPLVAHNLAMWGRLTNRSDEARMLLTTWQSQHRLSLDVTQALASLTDPPEAARQLYIEHMKREPSLVAAGLWLAGQTVGQPEQDALVKKAMELQAEPLKRYRCAACGFESRQYFWQCPGCQTWDSYPPLRVEEL
jgi:lipopolysaccharide biosynthesis regulator YciM